jgi:hypothetical protein
MFSNTSNLREVIVNSTYDSVKGYTVNKAVMNMLINEKGLVCNPLLTNILNNAKGKLRKLDDESKLYGCNKAPEPEISYCFVSNGDLKKLIDGEPSETITDYYFDIDEDENTVIKIGEETIPLYSVDSCDIDIDPSVMFCKNSENDVYLKADLKNKFGKIVDGKIQYPYDAAPGEKKIIKEVDANLLENCVPDVEVDIPNLFCKRGNDIYLRTDLENKFGEIVDDYTISYVDVHGEVKKISGLDVSEIEECPSYTTYCFDESGKLIKSTDGEVESEISKYNFDYEDGKTVIKYVVENIEEGDSSTVTVPIDQIDSCSKDIDLSGLFCKNLVGEVFLNIDQNTKFGKIIEDGKIEYVVGGETHYLTEVDVDNIKYCPQCKLYCFDSNQDLYYTDLNKQPVKIENYSWDFDSDGDAVIKYLPDSETQEYVSVKLKDIYSCEAEFGPAALFCKKGFTNVYLRTNQGNKFGDITDKGIQVGGTDKYITEVDTNHIEFCNYNHDADPKGCMYNNKLYTITDNVAVSDEKTYSISYNLNGGAFDILINSDVFSGTPAAAEISSIYNCNSMSELVDPKSLYCKRIRIEENKYYIYQNMKNAVDPCGHVVIGSDYAAVYRYSEASGTTSPIRGLHVGKIKDCPPIQ